MKPHVYRLAGGATWLNLEIVVRGSEDGRGVMRRRIIALRMGAIVTSFPGCPEQCQTADETIMVFGL